MFFLILSIRCTQIAISLQVMDKGVVGNFACVQRGHLDARQRLNKKQRFSDIIIGIAYERKLILYKTDV